jgi:hypothetical protein
LIGDGCGVFGSSSMAARACRPCCCCCCQQQEPALPAASRPPSAPHGRTKVDGQRAHAEKADVEDPGHLFLEHHQSWKCWRCHCVISSRKKQQPGVQDALQSTALFHGTVHTHLTRSVVSPKSGSPTGGLPVTSSRRTTPKL